jgi:DNA-binding transcriptional LysR family regulator
MGCLLLARSRRRVELTPAGTAFLRDARTILAELDAAVATARQIHSGQTGRLRINFVGSALLSIVPAAVQRFRESRPEVEVELRERATVDQVRAVLDGVVDLGLVRPPIEPHLDLRVQTVAREPTYVVVPAGHPLAALDIVPLARVAAEPLVLFPRDQAPGFHDLLMSALAKSNPHPPAPRVVQYAGETTTIIGLVAAGIGVSLVPASVRRLEIEGVAYRAVPEAPDVELAAIIRIDHGSPLIEAFIEHARG